MTPAIERLAEGVYFVGDDGTRVRVHDVAFGPHSQGPGRSA
jgi:hypothetical protein